MLKFLVNLFIFLWGLVWGSFINVLIYRLPRRLSVVWGRSFCPNCRKKISWYDNIPLLSFILLKGKCRSCQKPISWRYPLVELLTGVLFVFTLEQIGLIGPISLIRLILSLILISGLIAIFFIDLDQQIIPDRIIFPLAILFSVYYLFTNPQLLIANCFMALISFSFFLLLLFITHGRGMGFGDVKFAFLIGLALGFPKTILALYLAFLTGALVGVILILAKKAKFGQKIPFGPFLSAATLVVFLWGEKIITIIGRFWP